MPDTKITALTAIGANPIIPATFPIPMVDLTDTSMAASGTTKKVTVNQILGAGGTATLASATITGDLTVDTSTLFVNSSNDRVGVGTVSPNNTLTVRGSQDAGIEVNSADSNSSRIITAYDPANTRFYINSTNSGSGTVLPLDFLIGNAAQYRIAASGIFSWYDGAGGTRMTLNASGLGVGVVPSAGKGALQLSSGINFPATQVASSDANTLDDYEEGTFTPTVVGTTTAGVGTYTTQVGNYTKIGNQVIVQAYISLTAHTGTGNLRLSGLPFANSAQANSFSAVAFGFVNNLALTAGNILTGYTSVGNVFIDCYQTPTGGGAATPVPIDASFDIIYTLTYRV